MRAARLIALLAVAAGSLLTPSAAHAGTDPNPPGIWQRIEVPGQLDPDLQPRFYWLREPVGPWSGRRPALMYLHGVSLDPLTSVADDQLDVMADHEGTILVVPEGWRLSWAAGGCCGPAAGDPTPPGTRGPALLDPQPLVDDVAFLDAAWTSAETHANVDLRRRAVLGYSNGGMLAAAWACAQGRRVPVVSVAGPLLGSCAHQVDLLHIHGRSDPGVPLKGGWSSFTHTSFPSTLTEASRIPPGSDYRLVLADMAHSWAPPGKVHLEDTRIWQWIAAEWPPRRR